MKCMMFRLCLVFILAFPVVADAKNLYVNNSGSPACSDVTTYVNNTSSAPWCTIGRAAWGNASRASYSAAQAAQAGDTVLVTAGTYSMAGVGTSADEVTLNPVNSGTSGSPIVFRAVGTVELRYSSGYGAMIGADSVSGPSGISPDYITWDGFTIYEANAPMWTGGGDYSVGHARCGYVIGCTIQNCKFYGDLTYQGAGGNHAAIWLSGTGYGGAGGSAYLVKNNHVQDYLDFGSLGHNSPGIMTYGLWDSVIENNNITNCGAGVHIKGYANTTNTVRKNLIWACGDGILFGTTRGTHKAYQNIIRNCTKSAIKMQYHVADAFDGTYYIMNNTMVNNANSNDEGASVLANYTAGSLSIEALYIRNNISYHSSGSPNVGIGFWSWDQWSIVDNDRNVYYGVTRWKKDATNYSTIATWRTATSDEANSITSDPLFVDASGYNYKLQGGSPAATIGVDLLDLDGDSQTNDTVPAGAYVTGLEVIGIDSESSSVGTIRNITIGPGVSVR